MFFGVGGLVLCGLYDMEVNKSLHNSHYALLCAIYTLATIYVLSVKIYFFVTLIQGHAHGHSQC